MDGKKGKLFIGTVAIHLNSDGCKWNKFTALFIF
jgi:hypothetical protein